MMLLLLLLLLSVMSMSMSPSTTNHPTNTYSIIQQEGNTTDSMVLTYGLPLYQVAS